MSSKKLLAIYVAEKPIGTRKKQPVAVAAAAAALASHTALHTRRSTTQQAKPVTHNCTRHLNLFPFFPPHRQNGYFRTVMKFQIKRSKYTTRKRGVIHFLRATQKNFEIFFPSWVAKHLRPYEASRQTLMLLCSESPNTCTITWLLFWY